MDPNYDYNIPPQSSSKKTSPGSMVRPSDETDLSTIVEEVYSTLPANTTPVDSDVFLDPEWNFKPGQINFKTSFDTAETTNLSNTSSFGSNDNDAEDASTRTITDKYCVTNDVELGVEAQLVSGSTSKRKGVGNRMVDDSLGKTTRKHTLGRNKEKTSTVTSIAPPLLDPSLILSMERTLFSALNVSWLFALGGIGLMAIGNDDASAMRSGITMIACSMVIVAVSFCMHLLRLYQLRTGNTKNFSGVTSTVVWTGLVSILLFSFLMCELYYGIQYPYLQRTASVSIENVTAASSTAPSSTLKAATPEESNQDGIDWDNWVFTMPSDEPTKDPTLQTASAP